MALTAAFLARAELDLPPRPLGCLAMVVYHEARGEARAGQRAVAHVVLNRAEDPGFPDRICAVVTQESASGCQFSWWCDGASDAPRNEEAFNDALSVAAAALERRAQDPTGGALYFVRREIRPGWTRALRATAEIGSHRFYAP